jgi:hypothetical protein
MIPFDRPFQTPRTTLTWSNLEEWLTCAWTIEKRRASTLHNKQAELHLRALPTSVIDQCSHRQTLKSCAGLLRDGSTRFRQSPRGHRRDAPQTALIVAIANRISQIDRAQDQASMGPGHNSRNAQFDDLAAAAPFPSRPAVPAARPERKRTEGGFVTGLQGERPLAPARHRSPPP